LLGNAPFISSHSISLLRDLSNRGIRFDITPQGQQIHIAFGPSEAKSSRHPCFKIDSQDELTRLQRKVWEHHVEGGKAAAMEADKLGEENSGELIYFVPFLEMGSVGFRLLSSRL
jgi:hypothetical protein